MMTLINFIANISITVQIFIMYACMRKATFLSSIKRGVNPKRERIILVCISIISFGNAILLTNPEFGETIVNILFSSLLLFYIRSIRKKHILKK